MINHVMRKENASRVFKTITPHWCSLYLLYWHKSMLYWYKKNASRVFKTIIPHWCSLHLLYWYKKVQILMQKARAGCSRRRVLERVLTFKASPLVSAMSSQVSDVFDIAIYIYIHIAILCTSPLVSFLFSSRKRKKEKNKNEKKEKNYTPLLWCVVSFLFLVC